jgi:hypothetical protein
MNRIPNLYTLVVMGFLSFILLTVLNNQPNSQILYSFHSDYFKQVWASTEEEEEDDDDEDNDGEEKEEKEDSAELQICNKLFESEACKKIEEENKELTEEEIKAEAIRNRYFEPAKLEEEKKSIIDNNLNSETEIVSTNVGVDSNSRSSILPNEIETTNVTNTKESIDNVSPTLKIHKPSINNQNVLTNSQSLDTLNQFQLIDLIASTISTANDIDKNRIILSLNDLIEPTKSKGGNVIYLLKKIADGVVKDPFGNTANKIINIAKTK